MKKLEKDKYYVWLNHHLMNEILHYSRESMPIQTMLSMGIDPTGFPFDSISEAVKVTFNCREIDVLNEPFEIIDHNKNVVFNSKDQKNEEFIVNSIIDKNSYYVQFDKTPMLETIAYGFPYSSVENALEDVCKAEGKKIKIFDSKLECVFDGYVTASGIHRK